MFDNEFIVSTHIRSLCQKKLWININVVKKNINIFLNDVLNKWYYSMAYPLAICGIVIYSDECKT